MTTPDLDAIRRRAAAASPGPWEDGDVWLTAGVMPEMFGDGKCGHCRHGEPVWTGKDNINGTVMQAHRHRSTDPHGEGHIITSADGYQVAGLYGYDAGGIVSPADQEFIRHAREDVPALLALVEQLQRDLARAER